MSNNGILGINPDNFLVGITSACVNGTPLGMIKDGSGISMKITADSDVPIRCAQRAGALLGMRQGQVIYEVSFDIVEATLQNLSYALRLPLGPVDGELRIGSPDKISTVYQLSLYGEGPELTNRRITFHKAIIANPDSLSLMHPKEPSTWPAKFQVLLDQSKIENWFYGIVQDY